MRNLFLSLLITGVLLLGACIKIDVTGGKSNDKKEDPADTEQIDEQPKEVDEETDVDVAKDEDTSEETKPTISTITGAEDLLKKTAEVMNTIQGMKISGEIHSALKLMGIPSNETTQVTGELSVAPFVQHAVMHTISDQDPPSDSEIYMTEEAMYMPHPENDSWISLPADEVGGNTGIFISEKSLANLLKYHDAFEFGENDAHYTLSFTGADDFYKEVIMGQGNESYQRLVDMITSISGTYEFTIDKDTFHIIAVNVDIEQTMVNMGMETHSIEQMSYTYSAFNEIDPVVVPSDIIENAVEITMPF